MPHGSEDHSLIAIYLHVRVISISLVLISVGHILSIKLLYGLISIVSNSICKQYMYLRVVLKYSSREMLHKYNKNSDRV